MGKTLTWTIANGGASRSHSGDNPPSRSRRRSPTTGHCRRHNFKGRSSKPPPPKRFPSGPSLLLWHSAYSHWRDDGGSVLRERCFPALRATLISRSAPSYWCCSSGSIIDPVSRLFLLEESDSTRRSTYQTNGPPWLEKKAPLNFTRSLVPVSHCTGFPLNAKKALTLRFSDALESVFTRVERFHSRLYHRA